MSFEVSSIWQVVALGTAMTLCGACTSFRGSWYFETPSPTGSSEEVCGEAFQGNLYFALLNTSNHNVTVERVRVNGDGGWDLDGRKRKVDPGQLEIYVLGREDPRDCMVPVKAVVRVSGFWRRAWVEMPISMPTALPEAWKCACEHGQ